MKKGYSLVVVGLFFIAYILKGAVQPLELELATPYNYIDPKYFSTYPFTTVIIFIRGIAIWLTPIWFMSFFEKSYVKKSFICLVLACLGQLYVLQELTTGNQSLPLEWSLAVAFAGLALLPMMIIYAIQAGLSSAYSKLTGGFNREENDEDTEEEEEEE